MTLGKVVATVVSTEKHVHYKGQKILVVQPIDASGKPKGKVLVVDEGGSARLVVGEEQGMTIRTAICAIVDHVDVEDKTT